MQISCSSYVQPFAMRALTGEPSRHVVDHLLLLDRLWCHNNVMSGRSLLAGWVCLWVLQAALHREGGDKRGTKGTLGEQPAWQVHYRVPHAGDNVHSTGHHEETCRLCQQL
jgi:hypothetical protein